MKPLLAALLLCLGCRAHFEEQVQRDEHAQSETDSDRVIDKHVVDAPDKTTTTIEEFAQPGEETRGRIPTGVSEASAPASVPRGVRPAAAAPLDRDRTRDGNLPEHGPLVKRTVIVAEHGAVTTDLHIDAKSQERADSEVNEKRHTESTFDFLHGPFAILGGLVVLAGVAYVAWTLLRPRFLP